MMGDSSQQPESRKGRSYIPLFIILALLALAIFGDKGLLRVFKASRQKAHLQGEIQGVEQTNAQLRREIDSLRHDRKYIEGLARKELGMVKEDELVYQFPPPSEGEKDKDRRETP